MGEMPLILFTVLSQMAVGAAVTLWLLDVNGAKLEQRAGAFVAKGIVAAVGISLLASLAHLGHPFEAYRALSHITSSWLSREVALFGIFLVLSAVYWRQWQSGADRKMTGLMTAITGILAVIASGMIYVLPAQPAWNSISPVLFFLLTAVVLGPLFVAALLQSKQYVLGKVAFSIVTAGLICGVANFALYVSMLFSQGSAAALTGGNIILSMAFWPRLAVGWAAPVGILAYAAVKPEWDIRTKITLLFALVFIGELLGRGLFYGTSVALTVAGM